MNLQILVSRNQVYVMQQGRLNGILGRRRIAAEEARTAYSKTKYKVEMLILVCRRCAFPILAGQEVYVKRAACTINGYCRNKYYHVKCAEAVNLL